METQFQSRVYQMTKRIPAGKVATYGQLAELVGSPGAARAVGMCMKSNKHAPIIPCHRVVAADGKLTGYSAGKGVPTKKEMLHHEGVHFVGENVDLVKSQWDGKKT
jgi:methylated-DNA-[protein]-cysteine S-methyltransferase